MIVQVLKNEKNHLEVELSNLTVAELVRNELWEDDSVTIAAWKKDHPIKNPVLVIKTSGKSAQKALADCLERVEKKIGKLKDEAKKAMKK